jgi:hypothetical protein
MSLYCGMLLTYWAVLTFAPVEEPTSADWSAEMDGPRAQSKAMCIRNPG